MPVVYLIIQTMSMSKKSVYYMYDLIFQLCTMDIEVMGTSDRWLSLKKDGTGDGVTFLGM